MTTITLFRADNAKNARKILKDGLLPINLTGVAPDSYDATDPKKVYLSKTLRDAKFYTMIHKKWIVLKVVLTSRDYKELNGNYIGGYQYTFDYIPKEKISIHVKN